MPSGGARTRSGPAPDPNSARSDGMGWTLLPASGRTTPAPDWPLTEPTAREREMWLRFWSKPQALLWDRDGQLEYVAIFVRQLIEAEGEKASAENRKTVRMMFADLYLTSDSMARARVKIVSNDELGPRRTRSSESQTALRLRLRAVDAQ